MEKRWLKTDRKGGKRVGEEEGKLHLKGEKGNEEFKKELSKGEEEKGKKKEKGREGWTWKVSR